MQRWQTRARRWESRAAERRSKRRLGNGLGVAPDGVRSPLANDNQDEAATDVPGAMVTSGDATSTTPEVVASTMVA